jgi:hypothetical protein
LTQTGAVDLAVREQLRRVREGKAQGGQGRKAQILRIAADYRGRISAVDQDRLVRDADALYDEWGIPN